MVQWRAMTRFVWQHNDNQLQWTTANCMEIFHCAGHLTFSLQKHFWESRSLSWLLIRCYLYSQHWVYKIDLSSSFMQSHLVRKITPWLDGTISLLILIYNAFVSRYFTLNEFGTCKSWKAPPKYSHGNSCDYVILCVICKRNGLEWIIPMVFIFDNISNRLCKLLVYPCYDWYILLYTVYIEELCLTTNCVNCTFKQHVSSSLSSSYSF